MFLKKAGLWLIFLLLFTFLPLAGCTLSDAGSQEKVEMGTNNLEAKQEENHGREKAVKAPESGLETVKETEQAKEEKITEEQAAEEKVSAEVNADKAEAGDLKVDEHKTAPKTDDSAAGAAKETNKESNQQKEKSPEPIKWSITVEVLGEAPIEFTNLDAAAMGPVEIVAVEKDQEQFGEPQKWTGILLKDLLKYVGVTDFSVIAIVAKNGFMRELDMERLTEGTGIGWMVNGEMLDAERGPIQLIADQRGPKWWIPQVAKIEIIR